MQEMAYRLGPTVPADGVVAKKSAKQYPAALRVCSPQDSQRPTQIGRIAHRAVQHDEETLELSEVVALIISDIGNVDSAGSFLNCLDVRRLVGIVAVRYRP